MPKILKLEAVCKLATQIHLTEPIVPISTFYKLGESANNFCNARHAKGVSKLRSTYGIKSNPPNRKNCLQKSFMNQLNGLYLNWFNYEAEVSAIFHVVSRIRTTEAFLSARKKQRTYET
ncbi:unnamed protein product [Allacma fusca]|uniref:Uncharacterized protein n=1 Tax=Allacma fusca TaxID=39272 RepID=A0A8J2NSW5_9HEXA|nr:unnamed protein product [Allacma fusca]